MWWIFDENQESRIKLASVTLTYCKLFLILTSVFLILIHIYFSNSLPTLQPYAQALSRRSRW